LDQSSARSSLQHHNELKSSELEKGHYAIADLCQDLGIKTVSLQPDFQAEMAEKNLYRDGIHPNDNGQQVIAEAMLEELKPLVIQ